MAGACLLLPHTPSAYELMLTEKPPEIALALRRTS